MTEKRFKQLTGKGFTYAFIDTENIDMSYLCDNELDCKNIVDLLNELNDKNEQLKSELRTLRDFRWLIIEKNVSYEKERKELQLQMLRLYNYFEDYFEDTMSPESFSEMWDIVKESEKWEKR